jgi:hypothetical protein
MAGLGPPLPRRRLHGPAQSPQSGRGGGAAGPDGELVTPPLIDTVRTTSTMQRDVTRDRRSASGACTICWLAMTHLEAAG